MLKIVQGCRDSRLDSWVTRDWQAAKVGTRVKHAGKLKSHANYCIIGKKSQAGQAVSLMSKSRNFSPIIANEIGACLKHLDIRLTCALVFVSAMKISQSISRCEKKCGKFKILVSPSLYKRTCARTKGCKPNSRFMITKNLQKAV